jgi:DNA-binding transcriptional regulator GbsR (MarR family)
MNERLWGFVDATARWASDSYGVPQMTGRVLAWLLVCDPPEQTAAELAKELEASKGSISTATATLARMRLVERLHLRGERAERFRIRPGAWDDQVRDQSVSEARAVVALGLDALADEDAERRARLEELDAFYAWYQARMDELYDEWLEYKRTTLRSEDGG